MILERVRDPRTMLLLSEMLGGGINFDRSSIASKMKLSNKKTSYSRRGEISKVTEHAGKRYADYMPEAVLDRLR